MATVKPEALMAALMARKQLMESKKGKDKRIGVSTGFDSLDELMLLNKKVLFFLTGHAGYGKSEFLDALAVNTAVMHNWNWLLFSTENDDYSTHLSHLISKKIGKSLAHCSDREIREAITWANNHFAWLDAGDNVYSIDDIIEKTTERIESGEQVDVLVVDPWNELNHSKQLKRDDLYISDCMLRLRKFAKKYDVLPVVVIHPHGLEKNKDGNVPIPHVRDCSGGVMWANKAGYAVCIHRKDFSVPGVHVYVQKVKTKDFGYPGALFLDYEVGSGRFKDQESNVFSLPSMVIEAPFI